MILRAAAAKQAGGIDRLFVVGCLSERYADELRPELPEVDEFFGVKDWEGVVRALGGEWRSDLATERRLTTPRHYAYLKIGEGCDWKCGYCAIPLIRGPHVSVPMEQVLDEARRLAAGGVRELMVIAQDTTCLRGRSLRPPPAGGSAHGAVPHRGYRVDPPALRLSDGVPRRRDRGHGARA